MKFARIVNNVRIGIDNMTKEMAQDAKQIMVSKAPYPKNVDVGPGSESTGALKNSINYWKINDNTYIIGPAGNKIGNDGLRIKEYAEFADKGRGPVRPKTSRALVFYPKHSSHPDRPVVTSYARPMTGWNYVEETMKELQLNFESGKYKIFE